MFFLLFVSILLSKIKLNYQVEFIFLFYWKEVVDLTNSSYFLHQTQNFDHYGLLNEHNLMKNFQLFWIFFVSFKRFSTPKLILMLCFNLEEKNSAAAPRQEIDYFFWFFNYIYCSSKATFSNLSSYRCIDEWVWIFLH